MTHSKALSASPIAVLGLEVCAAFTGAGGARSAFRMRHSSPVAAPSACPLPAGCRQLWGPYLVTVNLILSATANIRSRFWEPKVQGLRKGMPGGSPSMITDPGLLLIRLYGTCTGYLIPKASPGREARGKRAGWQGCDLDRGSGSIPSPPQTPVFAWGRYLEITSHPCPLSDIWL